MTFSLHLDRTFKTRHRETGLPKDKHSVWYRSGRLAGLEDRRPSPYALDQPLYAKGYAAGLFQRSLREAALIFLSCRSCPLGHHGPAAPARPRPFCLVNPPDASRSPSSNVVYSSCQQMLT
jgi:hypothetical protein